LVLLNLLIKPIWLLLENIVQDTIGHEEYGVFAALYALGYLFIALSDLGVNMYTTKHLAGEPTSMNKLFGSIIPFKVLLCIVYPLFMVGVGAVLGYREIELYFLGILSFTQALLQLLLFFRSNFQASQFFRLDSFVSVSDKVILMVIVIIMMYNRFTLDSYIYARLFSAVITVMLFYLVLTKLYGWIKPIIHIGNVKKILLLSLPFALMTILYSFNEKIDQVMLERIGEVTEARLRSSLYAGSYRWLEAFQMYLWTVLPFFFAKFAFHQKEPEKLQRVFEMGQVIAAIPMIFVSVFVFFYSDRLFWLFDHSTSGEIEIMSNTTKILFLTGLSNGFFAIYGSLITCLGLEIKLSKYIIYSILLNIVLNFIFIPAYGTYAAAWSTFVSALFLAVAYIFLIKRKLPLEVPFNILFKLIALTILLLGFFGILSVFGIVWYMVTIGGGLFLLLMAYLFGLHKYISLNDTI
jgi:O-antigen/teichoic acid export membrane protein